MARRAGQAGYSVGGTALAGGQVDQPRTGLGRTLGECFNCNGFRHARFLAGQDKQGQVVAGCQRVPREVHHIVVAFCEPLLEQRLSARRMRPGQVE